MNDDDSTIYRIVTAEQATKEKGYPHPGNEIVLPDGGGTICLQYGHPKEAGRNGCFAADVLRGLAASLEVYQQEGHPLRCDDTERTIGLLYHAVSRLERRKADRQARGVHQTDKA